MVIRMIEDQQMCNLLKREFKDPNFKSKFRVHVQWMEGSQQAETEEEMETTYQYQQRVVQAPLWAYKVWQHDANYAQRTD